MTAGPTVTDQPAVATRHAGRSGPAGPPGPEQNPAIAAVCPSPRGPIGAIAHQRTPQQRLSGRIQQIERALQRRDAGGLGGRIGAPTCGQGLHEPLMERRRPRTECLIGLAVHSE